MLKLTKPETLRGEVQIPGDKSISHRAVMFGSIAEGTTHISNFLESADCYSTVDCFRRLGVEIQINETTKNVTVFGKGMHGLRPNTDIAELYTGNSGTTTRIISGILAPQKFTTVLSGDASVNTRPMKRIMDPLNMMGANIISINGNNCAPLKITGSALHGIDYISPVASAQVKSAILCSGLYADSETSVTESSLSRDHTERMLRAFGAKIQSIPVDNGYKACISPCSQLYGQDIIVPGDISSAAYFIAAGLLVPGSEVLVKNVGINPTRAGILEVAKNMGADITYVNMRDDAEPTADLLVKYSQLHGTVIEGDIIPALIDELPVIAVMAAAAEGTTIIRDASELKVKESDRIESVTTNLQAMGASCTPTDDGMIIEGGNPLHGAEIKTYHDHRIAMSFAVASLIADGETILDDEKCVSISFPEFFGYIERLKQ